MATHKSAEKASRQQAKRALHNHSLKAEARTGIKRVRTLLEQKGKLSADKIQPVFNEAQSLLMKVANKGILKKKAVSRTISRLSSAIAEKTK